MNITLRIEDEKDYRTVDNLTREAFWNVYRPGCNEHFILHKLRSSQAFIKELDFVAELGGEIVGNIVYSKAIVVDNAGTKREVIGFGPISVLPSYQKQGIGAKLIEHTVKIAKKWGLKPLLFLEIPPITIVLALKMQKNMTYIQLREKTLNLLWQRNCMLEACKE